jgi:PEP-CTERM motif
MTVSTKRAARPAAAKRTVLATLAAASAVALLASPAAAVTQSWNGYRWARTGALQITLGDNLGSNWSSLLAPTAKAWSAADNIDFLVVAGNTTPTGCAAVFGGVQVCSANYGANGWLGYANVWLSGGFIIQATVRLNDYYFATAKYNTAAWRNMTICQEIGHTLGLDHTNTVRTDANTGSCMDYTNDPSGTAGGLNGTLANTGPNAVDFAALNEIYAKTNTTQLASTKVRLGMGLSIDGSEIESFAVVPEPASWALLVAGFGIVGGALRRRRTAAAIAAA